MITKRIDWLYKQHLNNTFNEGTESVHLQVKEENVHFKNELSSYWGKVLTNNTLLHSIYMEW